MECIFVYDHRPLVPCFVRVTGTNFVLIITRRHAYVPHLLFDPLKMGDMFYDTSVDK